MLKQIKKFLFENLIWALPLAIIIILSNIKKNVVELTNSMFIKKIKNDYSILGLRKVIARYHPANVHLLNIKTLQDKHPHIIDYMPKNIFIKIICTSKKYTKIDGKTQKNVYIGQQASDNNKACYVSKVEIIDYSKISEEKLYENFNNFEGREAIIKGNDYSLLNAYIEKKFNIILSEHQSYIELVESAKIYYDNKKD